MKIQFSGFQAFPKIVPADMVTEITIEAENGGEFHFDAGQAYRVAGIGLQHCSGFVWASSVTLNHGASSLTAACCFSGEQEYELYVFAGQDRPDNPLAVVHVYSLKADLRALMPFKGDMHMHSNRSDGEESPAHVAAACRRIGLDFMAVTDHGRYAPSVEAQEAFAGVCVGLQIYRGEEVHPPDNPIHIINFGGSKSINDMFHGGRYKSEVMDAGRKLGELPEGVDRYEYTSAVWTFDQIRAASGLGIFCHPYWVNTHSGSRQGYYIGEALTTHMFDTRPFDAYELLGGYHLYEADSNILQVARYNEERARGRSIPIVGVSDAHSCENSKLFGWFYTIVFSRSVGLPDLIEGIKGWKSVAVEALPGEVVRVCGPFRLVKLALFLIRHVFPGHDALCFEEGQTTLDLISGSCEAAGALQRFMGRAKSLMNKEYVNEGEV